MDFRLFLVTGLTLFLTLATGCSGRASSNLTEERLRARISLMWSSFLKGDLETFASMLSERNRREFSGSDEEWQKHLRTWKSFLQEKPTFELLDVQITDRRAKVKMKESVLEKGGSRVGGEVYDYWVFENGDWFLDDAGRTK